MKKVLLGAISSFILLSANAQIAVRVDNAVLNSGGGALPVMGIFPTGNTLMVELIKGSPFYNLNWLKSKIVTETGKVYQDVPVKMNLFDNEIHFQDKAGTELVMNTPISEVLMEKDENGNRVHFINGNILPIPKKGWYQLLVNDTITLVKGYRKTLETHTSYGSAKDYSIATIENYFAFYNDKEYAVKKTTDLIELLPGKKQQIDAQAKKISSKLSKEEQLKAIVTFCNSLLGS